MSKQRYNIFRAKVSRTLALNIMSFVILALGINEILMGGLQITGITDSLIRDIQLMGGFCNG